MQKLERASGGLEEGGLAGGGTPQAALQRLKSLPSAERQATLRKLGSEPRGGERPATTSQRWAQRWASNVYAPLHGLQEPTGTWRTAVFLLISSTASPTLLSIPWAFSTMGWGPGVTLLLVFGASAAFASCLYASLADDGVARHTTLGGLADEIYGAVGRERAQGEKQGAGGLTC